jgi:nanoRNase/pAp phosphatase (c-di-AMP/oligoRNAs hydrolase)
MTDQTDERARRVHDLRAFAEGVPVVPILVQRDPDPDGMASALGIRVLLRRAEDASPIISLGLVTRAENRRMAELLDLQVTRVTEPELNRFERVIAVDTQPGQERDGPRFAVIDHHPPRPGYTAELSDIRPEIGAAASMVTEYLRVEDEDRISPHLATALLYGIRTDTDVLRRGATRTDIEAYAFLQELADPELLRKIGRPTFSHDAMRAVGHALAGLRTRGDIAVAYVGRLDDRTAHILPNLADFCLAMEGVSWSAAGGRVGDEIVVNLRRVGGGVGAGDLARAMAEEEGSGGGHHTMARVAIRLEADTPLSERPGDAASVAWLTERVSSAVEALRAVR